MGEPMDERIHDELALLRKFYPKLKYVEPGQWVLIEEYTIPPNLEWNRQQTTVCFQIPASYPGTPPYGFYAPQGLLCRNQKPNNYTEQTSNRPPFEGTWGFFSWQQENWRPTANIVSSSNLLNFVRTFQDRFREGA